MRTVKFDIEPAQLLPDTEQRIQVLVAHLNTLFYVLSFRVEGRFSREYWGAVRECGQRVSNSLARLGIEADQVGPDAG